ncbi:Bifunctional purine biosynthesis protein PurH [compost metagenome]
MIVKGSCTYAVAAGHQDGVTAIEHAIYKARNHCSHSHDTRFKGAVLAADGNFPNDIPVDQIKESGIDCFILPGNAANDDILVKQMLEIGCTVLFTRERCFQH